MSLDDSAGMQRLRARVQSHLDFIYGEDCPERLEPDVIAAMRYPEEVADPAPFQNYWD